MYLLRPELQIPCHYSLLIYTRRAQFEDYEPMKLAENLQR